MLRISIVGSQIANCSQYGGWNISSIPTARPQTINPTIKMIKTAGPSPLLTALKLCPHVSQDSATSRKPLKSFPFPHAGHLQVSPARKGETGMPYE